MKIALSSDHRGYDLKKKLVTVLSKKGYEIVDLGTYNNESTDFTKYAKKLAKYILEEENCIGVAICGTGIGMSIALNKTKGVYAAKISNLEEAKYAKEHNHANALALSSKLSVNKSYKLIKMFLESKENNEKKYIKRINDIKKMENNE